MSPTTDSSRGRFNTTEYRILKIQVVDERANSTTIYEIGQKPRTEPTLLRFGQSFRLRVSYECLRAELPEVSCGVAAAFTRTADKEPVMYFNTNYPHSDGEIARYEEAEFRKYIGRTGIVEGFIPVLQVKPGEYLLTVGILPNTQTHHEFYELHYLDYPIEVLEGVHEVAGAFYPKVSYRHEAVHDGSESPSRTKWRPIHTAPRDREIVVFEGRPFPAVWMEDLGRWVVPESSPLRVLAPTHWLILPAPE